jgi:hypothetical protein
MLIIPFEELRRSPGKDQPKLEKTKVSPHRDMMKMVLCAWRQDEESVTGP